MRAGSTIVADPPHGPAHAPPLARVVGPIAGVPEVLELAPGALEARRRVRAGERHGRAAPERGEQVTGRRRCDGHGPADATFGRHVVVVRQEQHHGRRGERRHDVAEGTARARAVPHRQGHDGAAFRRGGALFHVREDNARAVINQINKKAVKKAEKLAEKAYDKELGVKSEAEFNALLQREIEKTNASLAAFSTTMNQAGDANPGGYEGTIFGCA